MDSTFVSTKKCLICKGGKKNDCLHWHNPDDGDIWVYCVGKCSRAYSIYQYCTLAGLSLKEFLTLDFEFEEARPNEVQKMDWPKSFLPMFDKRSAAGVEYLKSRGLEVDDAMFYDISRKGIVLPYYYYGVFTGAQIRFLEPWTDTDGNSHKITTLPSTRLGLLCFNWDQQPFRQPYKAIVICEGAFNCFSLQQSTNKLYGSSLDNPMKFIALSGSSVTQHHKEVLQELKDAGTRIICASDSDTAGLKMLKKMADVATHYSLTGDDEIDWNDILQNAGDEELAEFFLRNIKKI